MDQLPKLKKGEKYVSGKEMFKDKFKEMNLPDRVMTETEICELFEPLFFYIDEHGKQNPMLLATRKEFERASWAYPGTFMKICKGELSREKMKEIINNK